MAHRGRGGNRHRVDPDRAADSARTPHPCPPLLGGRARHGAPRMWFDALDDIATAAHWRLIVLWKAACPAAPLPTQAPGGRGDWIACDQWHRFALTRINWLDPDLVIVSQSPYDENPTGGHQTPAQ